MATSVQDKIRFFNGRGKENVEVNQDVSSIGPKTRLVLAQLQNHSIRGQQKLRLSGDLISAVHSKRLKGRALIDAVTKELAIERPCSIDAVKSTVTAMQSTPSLHPIPSSGEDATEDVELDRILTEACKDLEPSPFQVRRTSLEPAAEPGLDLQEITTIELLQIFRDAVREMNKLNDAVEYREEARPPTAKRPKLDSQNTNLSKH
eukprot:GILK01008938.1.p1 GENE.GILK01008938.1~~GILK01008938.1.p1  ORF type:complete len:205 (-),score=27.79 GILK01008938.1:45-659(-)